MAGVRRRALLVGESERLDSLRRAIGRGRSGIDYEFIGELSPTPTRLDQSRRSVCCSEQRPDELIVSSTGLERGGAARPRRGGAPRRRQGADRADDAELLTQRAEYVPGQGVPLFELRPPVFAGLDWMMKRAFDVSRELAR